MLDVLIGASPLPNPHPALVHYPLALLPVAVLVDLASLVARRIRWLDPAASLLYVLGATGAVAAYVTGQAAADTTPVPLAAQSTLSTHADLAAYVLVIFLPVAVSRVGLSWVARKPPPPSWSVVARVGLWAVAALGVVLLVRVGAEGGRLVFQHGVGVYAEPPHEPAPEPEEVPEVAEVLDPGPPATRFSMFDAGAATWAPLPADEGALETLVEVVSGGEHLRVVPGADGLGLAIDGPVLLALGDALPDVAVEATLLLVDFEGSVGVAHHVLDKDHGRFQVDTAGQATLAASRGGRLQVLDTATVEVGERLELSVRATGRHFHGYLGDRPVTHGHISPSAPGRAGLFLDGRGEVRVLEVRVHPL